jgi:DNA-directed RNA polymerase subunit RPC12/RpoP
MEDQKMDEINDLPSEGLEEMDTFSLLLGTAKDRVERYTHCALCGANLHFTHITDFSRNLTQESARCPECGISKGQLTHRLH